MYQFNYIEYKVGVLVLNYNNAQGTIDTIESLQKTCGLGYKNLHIVVIDNASTDNSRDVISDYLIENQSKSSVISEEQVLTSSIVGSCTFILLNYNYGYAKGNNLGLYFLDHNRYNFALIINNDILFTEDIIYPLLQGLLEFPDAGVTSTLLKKRDGAIDFTCARRRYSTKELLISASPLQRIPYFARRLSNRYILKNMETIPDIIEADLPSGSCMMLEIALFRSIGFFDQNTFLYYEEDILAEKIRRINKKCFILGTHSAIHLGGETTKKTRSKTLLLANAKSFSYYMKYFRNVSALLVLLYLVKEYCFAFSVDLSNRIRPKRVFRD